MADFKETALLAFRRGALKKIIFSRPKKSGDQNSPIKISARLCENRNRRILNAESYLSGNTVSQKNYAEDGIEGFLDETITKYKQINLITALGDAELKEGKNGAVLLGVDKLHRKLSGEAPSFEAAIEALDKRKNYILTGNEAFLIALGVSDKNGRVHDKRQAKFRQINKFLEYIEQIYHELPPEGDLRIYDLCCGKSYLSFAVYYYLTAIKKRKVYLLGVDLKKDVIDFCNGIATEAGFDGMKFVTDDITNTPKSQNPDMVISLHACDIATDIVLNTAVKLGTRVILSTPCCHRELSTKISAPSLEFVTKYPKLKRSLCDTLTDALRLERLAAFGYEVSATELVDPDDTPKNTLIRAVKRREINESAVAEYEKLLRFIMPDSADDYIGRIEVEKE